MTWYSNEMQIVAIIVYLFIIVMIVAHALIEADTIPKTNRALFFIIIITFGLFKYADTASAKQNEVAGVKYKYKIEIIKGNDCDTYYTNEYIIKNGIIYFDNKCTNSFSIETLK